MVEEQRLVRAPSPRVLDGPAGLWLFASGDDGCFVEGESAALVRAILAFADVPVTHDEIVAHVLDLAGEAGAPHAPVDEAIALLARTGALVEAKEGNEVTETGAQIFGAHIVVGVTGAIGAIRSPLVIERLLARSHKVRVAMTRSARRFVTVRSLEALTHQMVAKSVWHGRPTAPSPHVELANWADLVVVYPCTATTLARIAGGDCSELVPAIATTTRAPVLLVPAMNMGMLRSAAVARNLEQLREDGFFIAHPSLGFEVADAPRERMGRAGGAAPVDHVLRCVALLLERADVKGPRLAGRGEWDSEHARADSGEMAPPDPEILSALANHAPARARVLDVGTGLGALARAAAEAGHVVVATDFSERAIERAHSLGPALPITWVVDDATDSSLRGTFDVAIDRGCFGCVPAPQQARYGATIAALLRPGGVWIVKVHRSLGHPLRAHSFTRAEFEAITAPSFEILAARESTLSFGALDGQPAWMFELRRRNGAQESAQQRNSRV